MKELNLKQLEQVGGGRMTISEKIAMAAILASAGSAAAAAYYAKHK